MEIFAGNKAKRRVFAQPCNRNDVILP